MAKVASLLLELMLIIYQLNLASAGDGESSSDAPSPVWADIRPVTFFGIPIVDTVRVMSDARHFMMITGLTCFILACLASIYLVATLMQTTTVVKLQVGLTAKGRSLQADLHRITSTVDTSTAVGFSLALKGVTDALLLHFDHCISSYSSVHQMSAIPKRKAEDCFKLLSMEERVIVNNIRNHSTSQSRNAVQEEYVVVTILVATHSSLKFPLRTINEAADLKKVLQELGDITFYELLAFDVLWTPRTLSESELLEFYPLLRRFGQIELEEGPFEDRQPFLGDNTT